MKTLFDILNENKKESYFKELHKTELIPYRGRYQAAINILNDRFKAIKDL
jgi:hypothetical protein